MVRGAPQPGHHSVILTSYRVVEACTRVGGPPPLISQGGSPLKTMLWAWDAADNFALLYVDAHLPAVQPAPPAEVGDAVVVVGVPAGRGTKLTSGVVSVVAQGSYETTVPIGPGLAGGPLLDGAGRVLGIATPTAEGGSDATRLSVTAVRSGQDRPPSTRR